MVRYGHLPESTRAARAADRLAVIETILDITPDEEFHELVNDLARWFHVGLRLEEGRSVPLTSEHLHQEIVRPTLLLLSDPMFERVDGLYRKAFDQALANDSARAVTAATNAVEEMLRTGLGTIELRLKPLARKLGIGAG